MSEEWLEYLRENAPDLYEQAVASRKHDTKWRDNHIRDLESQLSEKEQEVERLRLSEHVELDLMNAGAVGLAKQLLDDDGKGEMSPGPCADALALVRKLKTEKRKLARLVEAAKKVRHWHDTHDGGMVVSGESVRGLWEAIKEATGEGK